MSNNQIAQFLKNDYDRFKTMIRNAKIVFATKRSSAPEDIDICVLHTKPAGEFVKMVRTKDRLSHGMPKEFHVTIPM